MYRKKENTKLALRGVREQGREGKGKGGRGREILRKGGNFWRKMGNSR